LGQAQVVVETLTTGSDRWHLFAPAAATNQHGIKDVKLIMRTMHSNLTNLISAMHTVRGQDDMTGVCCPLFSETFSCMVQCAYSLTLVSIATGASSNAMHNDDVPFIAQASAVMIHSYN